MQSLERSRKLITRQRTRRAEKDLETTLLQGRVTRNRLKDFNKIVGASEDDNNEKASEKSEVSGSKDNVKVQLELDKQRRQQKIEAEKSAREQRRQKRLMRNEIPTEENKDDFKNLEWSDREILREFNRIKALRVKDKKNRRKRAATKSGARVRRGSVNTDSETDLFENPSDFEWPDADI